MGPVDHRSWRDELEALVTRGRDLLGDETVADALVGAAQTLRPEAPVQFRPDVPVLGVTSCSSGWVGVLVDPTGRAGVHVASTLAALVESVRRNGEVAVVGVDVGVGSAERNQAEAWLRTRPTVTSIGLRAEESLARSGGPDAIGLTVPRFYPGQGFEEDDLLQACGAAWTAARAAAGDAELLDADPTPFSKLRC